jgi:hypothetical protein
LEDTLDARPPPHRKVPEKMWRGVPLLSKRKGPLMKSVYVDPPFTDEDRRQSLFNGELIVLSPKHSTLEFCKFARGLIEEAFAPHEPQTAQFKIPVAEYADILQKLKPQFIHHPESKRLLRNVLEDYGCDIDKTYYEVPKLRSSTSSDYLTTGIAYAWHPHRDTWFAALPAQLNWWIPVYELKADNALAFYPQYWDKPIKNSSSGYNYFKWNKEHRGAHVSQYINSDPRPVPKATEPLNLTPEVRLIAPVGSIVLFSAAHLHASVPNTSGLTRFSFDFRTVHLDDVATKSGAPIIDSQCEGHMLGDYIRASDLAHIPQEYFALYEDGSEKDGVLVYEPATA